MRFARSNQWIGLAIIGVIAAVLRLWRLEDGTITYDEAFSWKLCRYPADQLIERTAADVHPPAYYLALLAWSRITDATMLWMRLFSVACSAVEILVVYFWTKCCLAEEDVQPGRGVTAGLFAAAILAVHPAQVVAARSARMYAFGAMLTAITGLALYLYIRSRHEPIKAWGVYVLGATSFVYTHNYAWFTLIAQWIAVSAQVIFPLSSPMQVLRRARGLLMAPLAIFLLYAPWIPTLLFQVSEVKKQYWIPAAQKLDYAALLTAWVSGSEQQNVLVQGISLSILAVVFGRALWRPKWPQWFLISQFTMPWILGVGVSIVMGQGIVVLRYLLFAHVPLVVCGALMCAELKLAALRRSLVVVVLLMLVAQLHADWATWQWKNMALVRAGSRMRADFEAQDVILCGNPALFNKAELLFTEQDFDLKVVFSADEIASSVGHVTHLAAISPDQISRLSLAEQTRGFHRVWYLARWPSTPPRIPGMRLVRQFAEHRSHEDHVLVSLFARTE